MNDNKDEKSSKALADEALDAVAGGKSGWVVNCVICHGPYNKIGPDGLAYCYKHYDAKWPKK